MEVKIIDHDNQDDFDRAFNEAYVIRNKQDVKRMFSEQYVPDTEGYQARRRKIYNWVMGYIEPGKPGPGNSPLRAYYFELTDRNAGFEALLRQPGSIDQRGAQAYKEDEKKVLTGYYPHWEKLPGFRYEYKYLVNLFEREAHENHVYIYNRNAQESEKITQEFAISRAIDYFTQVYNDEKAKPFNIQKHKKIFALEKFIDYLQDRHNKNILSIPVQEDNNRKANIEQKLSTRIQDKEINKRGPRQSKLVFVELKVKALVDYLVKDNRYFHVDDKEKLISLFNGKPIEGKVDFKKGANVLGTLIWDLLQMGKILNETGTKTYIEKWVNNNFTAEGKIIGPTHIHNNITKKDLWKSCRIPDSHEDYINIEFIFSTSQNS